MPEAPFQLFPVRRQDKDAHSIPGRQVLLDQLCSLHINVEQQVVASLLRLAKKSARRAVIIAENIGVFEEFAGGDHRLELALRDKEIFLAVLLAASRRSGGI